MVTERYRNGSAYDGIVRWCLSFHAEYGCRHSGACCRAGWSIPFDPTEAARVEALPLVGVSGLVRPRGSADTAFAATTPDGSCSFFEPHHRLCAIHRVGGQASLPLTCQMFPRVALLDSRGTFVSLSHYCPTAAGLLFDDGRPASIVEAPPSLVPGGALEGLDATDTWAPLLRPGVLMDVDSYGEWELRAIEVLTSGGATPWQALDRVEQATASILDWTPDGTSGALSKKVQDSFASSSAARDQHVPDGTLSGIVRRAVPAPLTSTPPPPDLSDRLPAALHAMEQYAAAVSRWLSARLFGTWIAYQGNGLRTTGRYLRTALDVLTVELARGATEGPLDRRAVLEAVRRSDFLIIHLAGSQRLATLLS